MRRSHLTAGSPVSWVPLGLQMVTYRRPAPFRVRESTAKLASTHHALRLSDSTPGSNEVGKAIALPPAPPAVHVALTGVDSPFTRHDPADLGPALRSRHVRQVCTLEFPPFRSFLRPKNSFRGSVEAGSVVDRGRDRVLRVRCELGHDE